MGCSSTVWSLDSQPPPAPPPPPPSQAGAGRLSSVCDAETPQDGVGVDGTGAAAGGAGKPTLPPGPAPEPALPKSPENFTLERLAQATGGAEKSWYRCVFPFGFISLVIGMAGTSVTFTFNTLPQIKVVSLLLLVVGFLMLLMAAICWRARRARRRAKKEGGFFSSEQGTL